jgi:hypothetical protein
MTNIYTEKYHQFLDIGCWLVNDSVCKAHTLDICMLHRGSLRCYMHIQISYSKNFKVLCIAHDGRRTQFLKTQKIHKKQICINIYFFKEIWSSYCIDDHDLDIISNVCLHRNCQVVSLHTFKNHYTLLISLECLVVLSFHLVTQIMHNTRCFINGTFDPIKVDVMNSMTSLFWPQGTQKWWSGYNINAHR